MADTLEQARELLEARLRELRDEEKQLSKALKQLSGGAGRKDGGAGRKDGKAVRHKARRRRPGRAARGQRREQLLSVIKAKPGAPVSEIAGQMGISPGQAYGLVSKARADKLIVKKGKGFAVK